MIPKLTTDPDSKKAIEEAIEHTQKPMLTLTRHAGWKLITDSISQSSDDSDFEISWVAANSVTGRIVRFISIAEVPEPCYETAAYELVELICEVL